MLSYVETNWKHGEGCDTHSYPITFDIIRTSKTKIGQEQEREEKISLVLFFKNKERIPFLKICRRLKEYTKCFQYDENKKVEDVIGVLALWANTIRNRTKGLSGITPEV
jgi:hypothetical protein